MTLPIVRKIDLIHIDPFSQAMLHALRSDLADAVWIRFMMCYFNRVGHDALAPYLARAMLHPNSRGLFTLTCACGAGAIEALARDTRLPRGHLRAFLRLDGDGPDDAKLIHSKMMLIVKPRSEGSVQTPLEAVLYVGSNNWTGAGLGVRDESRRGVNVETSIRIVSDWDPAREMEWLRRAEVAGATGSVTQNAILDAVGQMHRCFHLHSNTDLADPYAGQELQNWLLANCTPRIQPGSTPFLVFTAVLADEVDDETAKSGSAREQALMRLPSVGSQIYIQHYNRTRAEPDVFDSRVTWAFLVWESRRALVEAFPPWLILGQAQVLGKRDSGRPDLRSIQWLSYDPQQNAGHISGLQSQSATVRAGHALSREDLQVEYWSLAPVAPGVTSEQLNARTPDRHAIVEVMAIRAPESRLMDDSLKSRDLETWKGTELPFHRGQRRKRRRVYVVHDAHGPSAKKAAAMRFEQSQFFRVDVPSMGQESAVRVAGPRELSYERGPSGNPDYAGADVYWCEAPINELLFGGPHAAEGNRSCRDERGDQVFIFDVAPASRDRDGNPNRVPRMERLMAPGVPYVAAMLNLPGSLLTQLGLIG